MIIQRLFFTDLLYADDTVVPSKSQEGLSILLERFEPEVVSVGLHPSWPKKKIQNFATGELPSDFSISGHDVESVRGFVYLGTLFHSYGYCSHELRRRIGLVWSVFNQRRREWLNQQRLSLKSKLRVYSSCFLSVLLYASEIWTLFKRDQSTLRAFHNNCKRRILGVHWYYYVYNVEIAHLTGLPDIMGMIVTHQHSFFGHVPSHVRSIPHSPSFKVGSPTKESWLHVEKERTSQVDLAAYILLCEKKS